MVGKGWPLFQRTALVFTYKLYYSKTKIINEIKLQNLDCSSLLNYFSLKMQVRSLGFVNVVLVKLSQYLAS